jgi:hypothetical protein
MSMGRAGIEPATLGLRKSTLVGCNKWRQGELACKRELSALQRTAANCALRSRACTRPVRSSGWRSGLDGRAELWHSHGEHMFRAVRDLDGREE